MLHKVSKKHQLLGLCIVGIILLAIWVIYSTKQTTQDSPSLKAFAIENTGISFNYPENYSIKKETSDEKDLVAVYILTENANVPGIRTDGTPAISISLYDISKTNYSLEDWIKKEPASNFNLSNGNISKATISGKPALSYRHDGLYPTNVLLFAHNKMIVVLRGSYNSPEDAIFGDFLAVANSILLR